MRRGLFAVTLVLVSVAAVACDERTTSRSTQNGPRVVPQVANLRLSDAEDRLDDAGFWRVHAEDVSGRERFVVNPANWIVRSQEPAAGARVDTGTQITLRVSKPTDSSAPTTVTQGVVPDMVCRDLQAAQDMVQLAGLPDARSTDGTGRRRAQFVDRNWIVIAQDPAPGRRLAGDDEVLLTVVKFGEPTGRSGCRS